MDKSKSLRAEVVRRLLAVSAVFLLGVGTAHACSANLTQDQVNQANAFLDQNRSKDAFALMYPLSQQGSGGANSYLSKLYEKGHGLSQSVFMKRHLNWMGAQDNDPEAMYRTAVDFYDQGHKKDGEFWATRAKDCGNTEALMLLIDKFMTSARYSEARPLLETAIERSIPEAKYVLAGVYERGDLGISRNHESAFTWYYMAAKDGLPKAMSAVAYYFANGIHGVKDDLAAIEWYHRAARRGHADSMTAYGWMIANGRGTTKNVDEALRFFNKAASRGDESAARFLKEYRAKSSNAYVK